MWPRYGPVRGQLRAGPVWPISRMPQFTLDRGVRVVVACRQISVVMAADG